MVGTAGTEKGETMNEYIMRHDYMDGEDILTVVSELVRCKDCFLYGECQAAKFYGDDGYCSCGERRKDE